MSQPRPRPTDNVCGLCGHEMTLRRCGWSSVYERHEDGSPLDVLLCHADDHDCYTAWTRDGRRPCSHCGSPRLEPRGPVQPGVPMRHRPISRSNRGLGSRPWRRWRCSDCFAEFDRAEPTP